MNNSEYIQLQRQIAKNVKRLRKGKKLSQLDLALLADCSRNQVSRIENCEVNPSLLFLTKLAESLNTTVLELISK